MADPRRFYVDADGKLVDEKETTGGGRLVHIEGQDIDDARLDEFGPDVAKGVRSALKKSTEHAPQQVEEPETKEVAHAEVEDKEAARPRRNG